VGILLVVASVGVWASDGLRCDVAIGEKKELCSAVSGWCASLPGIDEDGGRLYAYSRDKVLVNIGTIQGLQGLKAVVRYRGCAAWDSTGKILYFLAYFSDTSDYLIRWQVVGNRVDAIHNVEGFELLQTKQYRDHLIVQRRKWKVTGIWNWYWLHNPAIEEVQAIGDHSDLAMFRTDYAGSRE
jgi:hypothetical protein